MATENRKQHMWDLVEIQEDLLDELESTLYSFETAKDDLETAVSDLSDELKEIQEHLWEFRRSLRRFGASQVKTSQLQENDTAIFLPDDEAQNVQRSVPASDFARWMADG